MMAQNPSFLPNTPFLTPTFLKEANLAPNPLFLLECPFPTPIFSKRSILAQALPKRTFLMPTFPELIFPAFLTPTFPKEPNFAQNPSFIPITSFLTSTFPKKLNLVPNPLFLLQCSFPIPIFSKRSILAQTLPKRTFSCPLSLKSHFGSKFPYFYPDVSFPVQHFFLE